MAQIYINTGNIANDGTGDPLRNAFNSVNNNFTQIFSAGLVDSNITIANNTIQVTNNNGNLKLATNGIGVIVPATNIVPDITNTRYIGTATNRFNTIFSQYLNSNSVTLSGNLYVGGSLNVVGNTITNNYSNANIANLTLTLAGGSSNAALANGAGIIVNSANANFVYNYSANTWNSTLSITAPAFIGNGSQLTNINAIVNANNLIGNTLQSSIVSSNLTTFGSVTGISATGNISTTGNVYANTITGNTINGTFIGDGSNITNITANAIVGNVPFALNANSAYTANLAALATQAINANTALFAINANLAAFANVATSAQTSNTSQYSVQSDNANSAVVAGMAYQLAPTANISVVGNITTSGYFIGNGSQLTGIVAIANYSNANVANYLPTYSGDLSAGNISVTGNIVGGYLYGDGGNITGLPAAYGNANVASYLPTYTGDLAGNNISLTGNIYSDGKILQLGDSGGNGTVINGAGLVVGANIASIIYDNSVFGWTINEGWHPAANVAYNLGRSNRYWNNFYALNINGFDVAIANSVNVTGNLRAGNISVTGSINSTNLIGNLSNGSSRISIQNNGNVSVGVGPFSTTVLNINTSTGISVLGNIVASGYISATGNITGNNLSVTGNILIGGTPLTRSLTVGTRITAVTVPLSTNNSFEVLTRDAGNIAVPTT